MSRGFLPAVFRPLPPQTLRACPDCDVPMEPFACRDVVIEKCPDCQGIWFDEREIGTFRAALDEFDLEKIEIMERPAPRAEAISACPRCREVLGEMSYAGSRKVKLGRCPRCRGLWLPAHQLVNFVEMAKVSQAIEPHVREVAKELGRIDRVMERDQRIAGLARRYGHQASPLPTTWWRALFRFFGGS